MYVEFCLIHLSLQFHICSAMIEQLLFGRGQFLFLPDTHANAHTQEAVHALKSISIKWDKVESLFLSVSLSLHRLTRQTIGWVAPPPSVCRGLINPVTHTHTEICAPTYAHYIQTHTHRLAVRWQSFRQGSGWALIHLHGNSPGMLGMRVRVCTVTKHGRQLYVDLHHTHRLTEEAEMDLCGDAQIWLIGLIGFQGACRDRQRLTLTRLLQRHQGSSARDRKSKKHKEEHIDSKCKWWHECREEGGWQKIYFTPWEVRRSRKMRRERKMWAKFKKLNWMQEI